MKANTGLVLFFAIIAPLQGLKCKKGFAWRLTGEEISENTTCMLGSQRCLAAICTA
uniref:Uncharacterized protein n=1 Tax=Globodera rostochiensis TaxID=31243 RepID=A0A914HAT7_GLORO